MDKGIIGTYKGYNVQDIVIALEHCSDPGWKCSDCPVNNLPNPCQNDLIAANLIRFLLETNRNLHDENLLLKKERNKAISDLHSIIGDVINGCNFCIHNQPCKGKDCPKYEESIGVEDINGKVYPDWKWTCQDIEWGQCPLLESTPCQNCNFKNNWQWKGI